MGAVGLVGSVNSFNGVKGLQTFDPAGTMISLAGYVSANTHECTFRLPTGTSGYATTGGGFLIRHVMIVHGLTTAQANGPIKMFSHNTNVDAGIDGADNAASGTATGVQYFGGSASITLGGGWLMLGSQQAQHISMNWLVPTSKYISFEGVGCPSQVNIFGIPQ